MIDDTYFNNFEPDYQDIKYSPNQIYYKYEDSIKKLCGFIASQLGWSFDDLMQEAYIYFLDYCKRYDPYYNNGFIPFDKFLFGSNSLPQKLRMYITRQRFKSNRETTVLDTDKDTPTQHYMKLIEDETETLDMEIDMKAFLEKIPERYQILLTYVSQGYIQQEIAEKMGLTQSRICVLLQYLKKHLKGNANNHLSLKDRKTFDSAIKSLEHHFNPDLVKKYKY